MSTHVGHLRVHTTTLPHLNRSMGVLFLVVEKGIRKESGGRGGRKVSTGRDFFLGAAFNVNITS